MYRELLNEKGLPYDLVGKAMAKNAPSIGWNTERITCVNRYTIPYETGMIVLLYHYSRPRQLCPEMEMIFGIRKSRLSAIIKTFSEALYNVAINYMVNPNIWHHRMPYYAEVISNKTGGVARDIWGFIDGTIRKTTRPIYHQWTMYT